MFSSYLINSIAGARLLCTCKVIKVKFLRWRYLTAFESSTENCIVTFLYASLLLKTVRFYCLLSKSLYSLILHISNSFAAQDSNVFPQHSTSAVDTAFSNDSKHNL